MFHISDSRMGRGFRWLIMGLAILSVTTLVVSIGILIDVRHEQKIVLELLKHSTERDASGIQELQGDLRWQYRLALLLIGEAIVAGVARFYLVRAYISTNRSLHDMKVLATDILASMDLGVVTTDRFGAITSVNPCAAAVLGEPNRPLEAWLGRRFQEIHPRFSMLDDFCLRVLDEEKIIRDEDCVVSIDEHKRTLRCGCTPLRDNLNRKLGTVLQVRDITKQALIQERMLRMERHMGLASLAAGLQHEIRNPLSALSLHIQLLDEQLRESEMSAEITETFEVLRTEIARIEGVLQGFRNYASDSEPGRTKVNAAELVRKLVRLITPQAEQQQVEIKLTLPEETVVPDELDSDRFQQVLLNLAVNALQAMPSGGVLSLAMRQTADELQITFADTGNGIPSDIQKCVFDPYFTTRPAGTGMGLALSEKIVRQHNGVIDLESSPAGTVFTVTIPRQCES